MESLTENDRVNILSMESDASIYLSENSSIDESEISIADDDINQESDKIKNHKKKAKKNFNNLSKKVFMRLYKDAQVKSNKHQLNQVWQAIQFEKEMKGDQNYKKKVGVVEIQRFYDKNIEWMERVDLKKKVLEYIKQRTIELELEESITAKPILATATIMQAKAADVRYYPHHNVFEGLYSDQLTRQKKLEKLKTEISEAFTPTFQPKINKDFNSTMKSPQQESKSYESNQPLATEDFEVGPYSRNYINSHQKNERRLYEPKSWSLLSVMAYKDRLDETNYSSPNKTCKPLTPKKLSPAVEFTPIHSSIHYNDSMTNISSRSKSPAKSGDSSSKKVIISPQKVEDMVNRLAVVDVNLRKEKIRNIRKSIRSFDDSDKSLRHSIIKTRAENASKIHQRKTLGEIFDVLILAIEYKHSVLIYNDASKLCLDTKLYDRSYLKNSDLAEVIEIVFESLNESSSQVVDNEKDSDIAEDDHLLTKSQFIQMIEQVVPDIKPYIFDHHPISPIKYSSPHNSDEIFKRLYQYKDFYDDKIESKRLEYLESKTNDFSFSPNIQKSQKSYQNLCKILEKKAE